MGNVLYISKSIYCKYMYANSIDLIWNCFMYIKSANYFSRNYYLLKELPRYIENAKHS